MNLGVILPPRQQSGEPDSILLRVKSALPFSIPNVEVEKVVLSENINLVVCRIPASSNGKTPYRGSLKRLKQRLDRIFIEENVLSVIEHPDACNLYGSGKARYDPYLAEIATSRLPELLRSVLGASRLESQEITLTGSSRSLEYAITKLITAVKAINILVPEGFEGPGEAESAFEETGIPVHITSDPEVLNRTAVWIRFPNDHEGFDSLPGKFNGRIIDLGELKVIDTRTKRIYNICLELPGRFIKKMGYMPDDFRCFRLPGFIAAYCANAWERSASEVSNRLGMRLSLKP